MSYAARVKRYEKYQRWCGWGLVLALLWIGFVLIAGFASGNPSLFRWHPDPFVLAVVFFYGVIAFKVKRERLQSGAGQEVAKLNYLFQMGDRRK